MTATIQPLGERILVEPASEADVTPSGIILARDQKQRPTEGTIVAVGPNVQSIRLTKGATVLFHRFAGSEFKQGDRTYLVLDAKDVLAVLLTDDEPENVVPFSPPPDRPSGTGRDAGG